MKKKVMILIVILFVLASSISIYAYFSSNDKTLICEQPASINFEETEELEELEENEKIITNPSVVINTNSGIYRFYIELADSYEERVKGLMFRESMYVKDGMLFIFESDRSGSFWMKNTLIPLDIIFIDSQLKVIDIKENTLPCENEPCPKYKPIEPARYVLELNGGISKEIGLSIGDSIELNI